MMLLQVNQYYIKLLTKGKYIYYKYEADQRRKNKIKQKFLDLAKYKKVKLFFLTAIFLALIITINTNFGLIYRKRIAKAKIINLNRMIADGVFYSHAIDNYFIEYKYKVASKNYISRFEIIAEKL